MTVLPATPLGTFTAHAEGGPSIWTDKADYAPNETVTIYGSGFAPGASYDVPVIRPDGSIVTGDGSFTPGWDTIQADSAGGFTYYYVLNGIAGPYQVRVYDSPWSGDRAEASLASASFTDAPHDINPGTHQGQRAPGGVVSPGANYTSGNITEYSEGDSINFRFTLLSTSETSKSGQMRVRFSLEDSSCSFFDGTFVLGTHNSESPSVVNHGGGSWTVSKIGDPTQDVGGEEWVQDLSITFTGSTTNDGEATVYYYLTLTDNVTGCTGSSQYSRLAAHPTSPGDVKVSGAQNVPVRTLPSLSISIGMGMVHSNRLRVRVNTHSRSMELQRF
jgi:hypothetical protein